MRLTFITALLFITSFCFAQQQNVYFLKNNGEYVQTRDSADYIRIVREPDSSAISLYNVLEYYPNGHEKLTGKSSTVDPPKFEGACTGYYPNGNKQFLADYKDGRLSGNKYEYYPNGALYLIKTYPDEINHHTNQDGYIITAERDSLGKELVKDGNGYFINYDNKFKMVIEEGQLKNSARDGAWKGKDLTLNITYVETYDNDKLVSGISTGKNGDSVKYNRVRGVEPAYKGGLPAFYNYLGHNIHYPDYEKAHNIRGKVLVYFVVEKDGSLSHVKIVKHVSENIDAEAIRVVKDSPNWIPATLYGRRVAVRYTIPINFTLGDK